MADDLPFPEEGILKGLISVSDVFGDSVTKTAIKNKAAEMIEEMLDRGEKDPLTSYVELKILSEFLNSAMDKLKRAAEAEAGKYSDGENTIHNVKFEKATSPTKYSYEHDFVWSELNKELSELKEKMKSRQEKMKTAMKFSGVFDEDGVEVEAAKITGGGEETLKITIPSI